MARLWGLKAEWVRNGYAVEVGGSLILVVVYEIGDGGRQLK